MHQGVDLHLEPRHRPGRAAVTGVRPGGRHQRVGDQHRGQIDAGQRREHPQRGGHPRLIHPVVGLADLDVQQHRQPHHRHRGQQVDGHRPPEQAGAHGNPADDRLHNGGHRHQPGVDEHLGPSPRPGHRQHGQRRGDDDRERDHPVAEFDGLVDAWHLGVRHRDEAAREALRPGGAAQARGGDADDRAGDGDSALGEDDGHGDQALDAHAGIGQQVHQPQQRSSEHCPMVCDRKNYSP